MNSIIKLTSGETIIAEVVHEDEDITCILEPLALDIGESESGRAMMVAMTWIPLTKKVNMVNLNSSHVIAIAEVDEEIDTYYQKSLAIMKHDTEKLKEILKKETGIETMSDIKEKLNEIDEFISEEDDLWMTKFGQPQQIVAANTVH